MEVTESSYPECAIAHLEAKGYEVDRLKMGMFQAIRDGIYVRSGYGTTHVDADYVQYAEGRRVDIERVIPKANFAEEFDRFEQYVSAIRDAFAEADRRFYPEASNG